MAVKFDAILGLIREDDSGTPPVGGEVISNKVTSISAASTDTQYPSAKLLYDQLLGKQASLGFTAEDVANKSTSVATDGASDTKYPSAKAVKDYADSLVVGLLDYRGGYDASVNTFPAAGGSGSAGAVLKGDMWIVSVAGTLGGTAVQIGDSVIANVDTPAQTAGNWNVLNANISFVPEDVANKVTSISGASTDTQYASAKLLYDQLALKANLISPTFTTPNIGSATGSISGNAGTATVLATARSIFGQSFDGSADITNNATFGTASSADGKIIFKNAASAFTQTFTGSNPGASIEYVLPTTAPTLGQVLSSTAPAAGVATLSWATAAGFSWGSSIAGATGTGVLLTMSDSYAAGGIAQSIVFGNTQTQALKGQSVNTGTAAVAHVGAEYTIGNSGANARGVKILGVAGVLDAINFLDIDTVSTDTTGNGSLKAINIQVKNNTKGAMGVNVTNANIGSLTDAQAITGNNASGSYYTRLTTGKRAFICEVAGSSQGATTNTRAYSVGFPDSQNSGAIGFYSLAGDTQTNAITHFRADLGLSAVAHIGALINNPGASSTQYGMKIMPSTTGTGAGIAFGPDGSTGAAGYRGLYWLYVYSGNTQFDCYGIKQDVVSNSNSNNTGNGYGLYQGEITSSTSAVMGYGIYQGNIIKGVYQNQRAYGLYQSVIDGTNASSATVAGFGWYVANIGAATAGNVGKYFSLNNAQSSASLQARTNDASEILFSRTNTKTSASVDDNFNLSYWKDTSIQNGAGGTLTVAGAVHKCETVATQTAGTLTHTKDVYNATQSATITTGKLFTGVVGATERFKVHPMVANTGTNEAYLFDTTTALSGTTNIATFRNAGVVKATIDNTGGLTLVGRLNQPMGEVGYFNTTGTSVTISAASDGATNMVVVAPTTTFTNDKDFDNGGANNGRLRYTGATTRSFHVAVTVTGSPATANDEFVFGITKNGTTMTNCKTIQKFGTSADSQATALHCMVTLATNDYIELYIGNLTAGRNITIKTLNIFAMGM